jgi:uncharacterized protein YlxP (DUF503 family)
MIVGAALLELHVHGSQSLKAKRGVVKSITGRVRNRFNVSVAEVGGQDTWQRCVLGVTACGSDPKKLRQVLDRVIDFVEGLHLAELRETDIEILTLDHQEGAGLSDDDLPWRNDDELPE